MKLRLLLWEDCNRSCEGCCNKDWNLDKLQNCFSYRGYELIMLTGGEPMLYPSTVLQVVREIRQQTTAPVYVYTADVSDLDAAFAVLDAVDGITLTLHEQADVADFQTFDHCMVMKHITGKSLRLNVFKGVDLSEVDTRGWQVKDGIEWIPDCPLPTDEVFLRYNNPGGLPE